MREYNGFTHDQRMASLKWGKEQERLGLRSKPTKCHACGVSDGVIDWHRETYAQPLRLEDEYPTCYRCHMAIHNRHNDNAAFVVYKALIARGYRFDAMYTRDFKAFWAWFKEPAKWKPVQATIPKWTVFDLI